MTERLLRAGFLGAGEDAAHLITRAGGDPDAVESLVARRLAGEPIAWLTGSTRFCGLDVRVDPGVYVPRWQSEPLARRAVERLPTHGTAIDLCTGSGAIALVLRAARPAARVLATDRDERAVACAVANGIDASYGDLFAPLAPTLASRVDVVVGVVPYVPTAALALLQRDTLTFESPHSYDGGPDGSDLLRRAVVGSAWFLRIGGALLLELGGDQAELLSAELVANGFGDVRVLFDEEDDVRGIEATLRDRAGPPSPGVP